MADIRTFYGKNPDGCLQVCLVLFRKCNLKCTFCFQDHDDGIDEDYIRGIPGNIRDDLARHVREKHAGKIVYRIWGGQLFADDVPDRIFDLYRGMCAALRELGAELGAESEFCFTSNFVFRDTGRVLRLLGDVGAATATSYDPVYRFHDEQQLRAWKENVELFDPVCVSITLTKQNIAKYVGEPRHLELLKGRTVYIEYYIYSRNWQFFAPSQDDLFAFYKYCVDNGYDNVEQIGNIRRSYMNPTGRYCTCDRSCLYLDGRLTFNCLRRSSNLDFSQFFDGEPPQEGYTRFQAGLSLRRNGCLSCPHFSYCRGFCLASTLHRAYSNRGCALARIYDYIGGKK